MLAAAAVGIHFEMNLVEIAEALKDFQAPAGRLNLIDGIKNTVIIEDSYNSAPQSALAALEVLEKIEARRKIAALGDMLELGEETEEGHREVGQKSSRSGGYSCLRSEKRRNSSRTKRKRRVLTRTKFSAILTRLKLKSLFKICFRKAMLF